MRKIAVVTGTRAEYGILYPVLKAIEAEPELELCLVVAGMHLSHEFGYTVQDIERDGFNIGYRVDLLPESDTPRAMAESVGKGIVGMVQAWQQLKPDVVLLLGDRTEPLAATIAGAYMNIPVGHIHGGDSTTGGCIDESTRHAITRFSHIHFPATGASADRLIRTGEEPWRIHIIGPLGIYTMRQAAFTSKDDLCKHLGLSASDSLILVVQHPVTTQVGEASAQMRETMEALVEVGHEAVVIYPNADAGGRAIIETIKQYEGYRSIKLFKNLPYLTFVSLMRAADVMIGNSSAAIVDAPLFGLPAVNIGIRQEGRQRGVNIFDVPHRREDIMQAIKEALGDRELRAKLQQEANPYDVRGDGAERIADILSTMAINERLLQKRLTY